MADPTPIPPAPEPPTDEELLAMRSWSSHGPTLDSDLVDFGRRCYNLGRWGTSAIQPVTVSERLPLHLTGELDGQGTCWNYHPINLHYCLCVPDPSVHTHWLPHWALPVPTNTINQEDYDRG